MVVALKKAPLASRRPARGTSRKTSSETSRETSRLIGGHRLELSNLDKVLLPDGITKGDLIDYYDAIAPRILPHLRGRPLVVERYPDGLERGGFFQKQIGEHFPSWVKRVRVRKEGGWQTLVLCEDRATLVYLANQASVVLHPWLSCAAQVRRPDTFVLDLDPASDDFARVRRAALQCRALFDELGMPVYLKTSGSRGLHLCVPLAGSEDFDTVREVASRLAGELARRHAQELTVEHRKAKRGERVYLDVARNAYAQTAVAAYSVRALAGAPVSAPIDWEELDTRKLTARTFTIRNVMEHADPWTGWRRKKCTMETVGRKLDEMAGKPALRPAAALGRKKGSR